MFMQYVNMLGCFIFFSFSLCITAMWLYMLLFPLHLLKWCFCDIRSQSQQWRLFLFVRKTLQLARQLKDRAVEAQACYSLGNTYTLLQDYERAIDYHLKHLIIAQDLNDRCTHFQRQGKDLVFYMYIMIEMLLLQDRGGPCMLESGKCLHCTGEPWPGHALCWETPGDLQRGTSMVTIVLKDVTGSCNANMNAANGFVCSFLDWWQKWGAHSSYERVWSSNGFGSEL